MLTYHLVAAGLTTQGTVVFYSRPDAPGVLPQLGSLDPAVRPYLQIVSSSLTRFGKHPSISPARVALVGFGTGAEIDFFLRTETDVHGIDVSPLFVDAALARYPGKTLNFICGDMSFLDRLHPPVSCSAVVFNASLVHLREASSLLDMLRQAFAITKISGRVYVRLLCKMKDGKKLPPETDTIGRYFRYFTLKELLAAGAQAGFTEDRSQAQPHVKHDQILADTGITTTWPEVIFVKPSDISTLKP